MKHHEMIEETLKLGLGKKSKDGALIVDTGKYTGRSAGARYIVKGPRTADNIDWGSINKPFPIDQANLYFQELEKVVRENTPYSTKGFVGIYPIEVTSTSPWHIAFAHNMFREKPVEKLSASLDSSSKKVVIFHDPDGKLATVPGMADIFKKYGNTLIILDLENMRIGITGTAYAGEIKKSAFSLCNYLLPEYGILPMHASANCLEDGNDSAVLFGLSGTGKTTLSANPERPLIGDDEIIWTKRGLSNLEGGCYAKLIDLDPEKEPEIHRASNQYGAILENVVFDDISGTVDFFDGSKTENTRSSYCISAIERVFDQSKEAAAPRSIVFLTADAFGAMPAVAKLDNWQTQYHFMSGYTAKVAGTEIGVTEPQTVFSACFGAPFMPRPASTYAKMLSQFVESVGATVWLVNTGWVGGYEKGKRFPIKISRDILANIQVGELEKQPMVKHPVFGFMVPTTCNGVPSEFLQIPTGSHVNKLARAFSENIKKHAKTVDPKVVSLGGPKIESSAITACL